MKNLHHCPKMSRIVLALVTLAVFCMPVHAVVIKGEVIAVNQNDSVTIQMKDKTRPDIGDQVVLSFLLSDDKFTVGTWRVSGFQGDKVLAEKIQTKLPPSTGMLAEITTGSTARLSDQPVAPAAEPPPLAAATTGKTTGPPKEEENELFWLEPGYEPGQQPRKEPPKESVKQSPPPPPAAEKEPVTPNKTGKRVQVYASNQYTQVWNDSGSGAELDFATFRAKVIDGFYPLGDTGVAEPWEGKRYAKPAFNTLLVKSGTLEVKPPVDYQQVWNTRGSPADKPFSSWSPVAPQGYYCLGDVGIQSLTEKPSLNAIRCLPRECVVETSLGKKIWTDKGSNAELDFSAWEIPGVRVYAGTASHKSPRGTFFTFNLECL